MKQHDGGLKKASRYLRRFHPEEWKEVKHLDDTAIKMRAINSYNKGRKDAK